MKKCPKCNGDSEPATYIKNLTGDDGTNYKIDVSCDLCTVCNHIFNKQPKN